MVERPLNKTNQPYQRHPDRLSFTENPVIRTAFAISVCVGIIYLILTLMIKTSIARIVASAITTVERSCLIGSGINP